MIAPLLETKRLFLTPFNERVANSKFSNYFKWFLDQEVTKYNSHGLFPQSKEEINNFLEGLNKPDNSKLVLAMIDKENEKHIGNIALQRIDWINRSAEFVVIIGEKDYWGKGICTEAAKELFKHGFNRLNLHRIWSGTAKTNIGMQKVFRKLGMEFEGEYRDGVFLNGEYVNVVAYAKLSPKEINYV